MPDILIVDDDTILREMLLQMMDMEGFSAIGAENGDIALKILGDTAVKLVITDIVMPEKEGLETIMLLRKKIPQIQIIAVSGGGRMNPAMYLQMAQNLGARYTFTKPFDRGELMAAVRTCLGLSSK